MAIDDRPPEAKRLEIARKKRGFDRPKDAARYFGWTYETYIQHEQGKRGIPRAAKKYAKAFRVSEAWLLTGEGEMSYEVPLKRYIGAGQAVYALDDGGDETVEAPRNSDPDTIAAVVKGNSMYPKYEDGTILYWSRTLPPEEMVNKHCVVQLASGEIMVKELRRGSGPGLYTLGSLNAEPIEDVSVEWAAPIDWTKPAP